MPLIEVGLQPTAIVLVSNLWFVQVIANDRLGRKGKGAVTGITTSNHVLRSPR